MKKLVLLTVFLLCSSVSFSQIDNGDITFYNTENSNIVSNYVNDFDFDNNGNVWIIHGNSELGLSMFDGTSFINHVPDINIPTDVTFKDIEIDNNNNIWVLVWQKFEYGCNCYPIGYSRALLFFDGTNWEYYTPSNSQLPTIYYGSIKTDSLGNVWFITSQGLSRFNGNNLVVYSPSAFSLPTPSKYENNFMEIDDNDIVWIASFGLISFNNGNWVLYSNPIETYPFSEVSKIYNNNIYLDGHYKFDGNNFTIFSSYNGCDFDFGIDKLDFDSQGNLWITYFPQSGFYINDSFYYVSLKRTENCSYYLSGEWYESGEDYEYVGCSQMKIDNYDNIWGVKNYSEGLIKMSFIGLNTNEYELQNSIIYPNPAIDEFTITNNQDSGYEYFIYDISGKLVQNSKAVFNEPIDISRLQQGTYVVKTISNNNRVENYKIIKN